VVRLFTGGSKDCVRSLKKVAEREISTKVTENVIMQCQDVIFAPVKQGLASVRGTLASSLGQELGIPTILSKRQQHLESIGVIRSLVERNAKEREIQEALVNSQLVALDCRVIQEVAISPTESRSGIRMDLVLSSTNDHLDEIIELKRGSHLLLARQGKPTQRLSRQLEKAIKQLKKYGVRVTTDISAMEALRTRVGIRLEQPLLRLIAGRRLSNPQAYHLLSTTEGRADDSNLRLLVQTWDGFLAELERIHD